MTTHTYRLALCILMGYPYLLYQDPRHRPISVGANSSGSVLLGLLERPRLPSPLSNM